MLHAERQRINIRAAFNLKWTYCTSEEEQSKYSNKEGVILGEEKFVRKGVVLRRRERGCLEKTSNLFWGSSRTSGTIQNGDQQLDKMASCWGSSGNDPEFPYLLRRPWIREITGNHGSHGRAKGKYWNCSWTNQCFNHDFHLWSCHQKDRELPFNEMRLVPLSKPWSKIPGGHLVANTGN